MSNFLYIRILFIMNQFQYSTQFLKREQGFFATSKNHVFWRSMWEMWIMWIKKWMVFYGKPEIVEIIGILTYF